MGRICFLNGRRWRIFVNLSSAPRHAKSGNGFYAANAAAAAGGKRVPFSHLPGWKGTSRCRGRDVEQNASAVDHGKLGERVDLWSLKTSIPTYIQKTKTNTCKVDCHGFYMISVDAGLPCQGHTRHEALAEQRSPVAPFSDDAGGAGRGLCHGAYA